MKVFILGLILLSSYVFAQSPQDHLPDCSADAGFKDKQEMTQFTEKLKKANTAETLSPLISYPLKVNESSKKHFMLKSEGDLKARFKEVFPETLLNIIQTQDPKITFCNYQGLTIGGAIWINKKNGKTGIYVVNLPKR